MIKVVLSRTTWRRPSLFTINNRTTSSKALSLTKQNKN